MVHGALTDRNRALTTVDSDFRSFAPVAAKWPSNAPAGIHCKARGQTSVRQVSGGSIAPPQALLLHLFFGFSSESRRWQAGNCKNGRRTASNRIFRAGGAALVLFEKYHSRSRLLACENLTDSYDRFSST